MNMEMILLAQAEGGFGNIGIGYWVLIGATMLLSMLVSGTLKKRFHEHSQVPTRMTGAQVAEAMLRQNGIDDVRVVSVPGQLTDHYDPTKKTVNLSESVYHMNNVAAVAVAAHECGHALQHQQAYAWLQFRSKMVPAVQIASQLQGILMMLAIFGAIAFQGGTVFIWVFLAVLGVTTLFSVVTLPVEFDASKRALAWMERSGAAGGSIEHERAKNALHWAAMTYVAAAVGAVAQLAYWAVMLLGRRD